MLDLDPGASALPGEHGQPVGEIVAVLQVAAAAWAGDEPVACGERLEHIGDAAQAGGLPGLKDLCLLLQQWLGSAVQVDAASDEVRRALAHFSGLAAAYVQRPSDEEAVAALIATLRKPPLAAVQSEEDAVCLADMLLADSSAVGDLVFDGTADGGLPGFQLLEEGAGETLRTQEDAALPSMTQMFDLAALAEPGGTTSAPSVQELVRGTEPASPEVLAAVASDHLGDLSDALEAIGARLHETAVEQRVTPQTPFQLRPVAEPARAAAPLPTVMRELIDVMIGELPEVDTALATFVGLSQAKDVDADVVSEAFERAAAVVERFGAASASVGFKGLEQVCTQVGINMQALQVRGLAVNQAEAALLHAWSQNVRRYLEAPLDAATAVGALEWLSADAWPQPVDASQRVQIEHLLRNPDFGVVEAQVPVRQSEATAGDVALTIPEDVNQDLLDGMLQELPTQAEEFSAAIQRLISGGTQEDIRVAQRISHTIKGAGNTVGITGLANLAHHLEDILLALARTESLPTRSLAETLMNAADCLESMSEALIGAGSTPREAQGVLQDVLDWANRIDREGLPHTEEEVRRPTPDERSQQRAAATPEAHVSNGEASPVPHAESEATVTPMLRVPAELVDELLRLVGETIILTGQVHQRLDRTASDARAMHMQFDLLQQLGGELEELVDVKDLNGALNRGRRDPEFDALEMDQYNELHTCSRRLVEAALDARQMGNAVVEHLSNLDDMLVTQESLNRASQEAVLRTRMVPVKSVFPRLQRSLRQACRMTRKQAALNLSGGDTLMDGDVLTEIVDSLMHLLRNAVDHGIEDVATRQAAGKDPVGQVFMDFLRDGNNILVRCRDDGAGLDLAAIQRTAGERGIIAAERDLPEEELKRLILRPNFSTRTTATQVSGRGIGLDAVNSQVARLGGGLTIDSAPGGGCTFELRLPFTLISSHALLVRTGGHVLALASRGIEQILHSEDGKLQHFGSELIFHSSERLYRAMTLESIVGMGDERRHADRQPRSVVLVRAESGVCAVLVESVLESRDLVVKHLGRYLPKLPGVIGATILGDGSVTPVIDLPELLRAPQQAASQVSVAPTNASQTRPLLPTALVVDDSLSARRALAQVLSDAGYEVRTARDGVEAAEVIEVRTPDIMLVDMEMPRMNGIELTAHVRSRAATARLPVIMVTSRSTSKHRQQAEAAGVDVYLTKPFAEDHLLEHVQTLLRASHADIDKPIASLAH